MKQNIQILNKQKNNQQLNIPSLDSCSSYCIIASQQQILNYKFSDFQILQFLGKGSYSQVYLVRKINTKDLFAMKIVQVSNIDQQILETFRTQQQIFKNIKGSHTVSLYYSFQQGNLYFFILSYESGGSLRKLLQNQIYLNQNDARVYLFDIVKALEQIHSIGVIHRDLKPVQQYIYSQQNIVISSDGHLKLTDFNLSTLIGLNDKDINNNNFFGTPDYIAPQVIKCLQKNNCPRDIWSLGIIAYEMLIGVTPFQDMTVDKIFNNILEGVIEWPQIGYCEGMISPEAQQLIVLLLNPSFQERITFNQIYQHAFFKVLNDNNYQPMYIPKNINYLQQKNNEKLMKKISNQKISKQNQLLNLDSIIRYDILKEKTSKLVKSAKLSIKKSNKNLEVLQQLNSTCVKYNNKKKSDSGTSLGLQITPSITQIAIQWQINQFSRKQNNSKQKIPSIKIIKSKIE